MPRTPAGPPCPKCHEPMKREPDAPPAYPPRRMIWVRRWSCTNRLCDEYGQAHAEGNVELMREHLAKQRRNETNVDHH